MESWLMPTRRLQQNATHKDTFTPNYISLSANEYDGMVRTLKLPFRAIESGSVVGPFFWCSMDQDDDDPHLRRAPPLLLSPGPLG